MSAHVVNLPEPLIAPTGVTGDLAIEPLRDAAFDGEY